MRAPSFIPAKEADYAAFADNFRDQTTASPATYGITAPNAVTIKTAVDAWDAAYSLVTNPATKTKATVAAKNTQKAATTRVLRYWGVTIARNPAVNIDDIVGLGLNPPNPTRTKVTTPTDGCAITFRNAQHNLAFFDYAIAGSSSGKAKPEGVGLVEVAYVIGIAPAVNPDDFPFAKLKTKTPFTLDWTDADRGKIITVAGRFTTGTGPNGEVLAGPWGALINFPLI